MKKIKEQIAALEKKAAPVKLVQPNEKFQQYKEEHPGTHKTPNDPMFLTKTTASGKGIPAPHHPVYQKELTAEGLANDLPHFTSKDHRDAANTYKWNDATRHIGYAHHRAADLLDFKARQQQQPPAKRVATEAIQKAIDALHEHMKNPKKPTPEEVQAVMDKHKKWKAEDAKRAPQPPKENKFQEYKREHPLTKKTPNDPMFLTEKTRSGKDIPSPKHPVYNRESEFHGAHDAARDFKGWTPDDHMDAAQAHKKHEGVSNGRDAQTSMIHQDAAHLVRNNKPHYSQTPEWQGKKPLKTVA